MLIIELLFTLTAKREWLAMPIRPYITLRICLCDELRGPTESLMRILKDLFESGSMFKDNNLAFSDVPRGKRR